MAKRIQKAKKAPARTARGEAAAKAASKSQRTSSFRKSIAAQLTARTARLKPVLERLIEHNYPEDFWQLDFEIHANGVLEVVAYFFREGFDQVMDDDVAAKRYPLSQTAKLAAATRLRLSATEKKFRANDEEHWFNEAASRELIDWFRKNWVAAGGKKFGRRARIARHDASERLDLTTGRWTKDG